MHFAVRLIPIMIATAGILAGLRVGELWHNAGAAFAQQPPRPAAAAPPSPTSPPPAPALTAPPPAGAKAPAAPAAAGAAVVPPAPAEPTAVLPRLADDPGAFTAAELEVLQGLVGRRAQLEDRARDLERREALLRAAEGRIEGKVLELRNLQASVEGLLRRYDEQEDTRKRSLVKIFETMKPKDAARLFDQMDMPVLVELVDRMREAKVASIISEMAPARAKVLTGDLAKRRQLGSGG